MATSLKERVLELAEISKQCPENLQALCFEMLLRDFLDSRQEKSIGKAQVRKGEPLPEDTTPAQTTSQDIPDSKGQDDISESDLHIKTRHFMKKCNVSIDQLNNLYYKEGSEIKPLYEDLKTTRMAEGQIRITLLQALRNAMTSGDFDASIDEVRQEATARKCYDKGNFARNFNNNASLFDIDRYDKAAPTIRVSDDGKKELAEIIKELQ